MDVNNEEFKKVMEKSLNWYNKHILTGVSPTMTNEDIKWFNSLK
jgi:hypothetical protein